MEKIMEQKKLSLLAKVDVRTIPVEKISIAKRIRVDAGNIEELAANIQEHGLINPISVMEQEKGGYLLITGYRRLQACIAIGCDAITATVMNAIDAEERLKIEISENEERKNFTVSEKLEYAAKMKIVEQEKGKKRMSIHARDGYAEKEGRVVRPIPETETKGRARDKVAKTVGLGSGRQMERAEFLARNRPDLLKKVDEGETSIYRAYVTAQQEKKANANLTLADDAKEEKTLCKVAPVKAQENIVDDVLKEAPDGVCPENENAPVYVGTQHSDLWKILVPFNPGLMKNEGRGIKGADHRMLMQNPIYAMLFEKYKEALQSANMVIGSYDHVRSEYETKLRGCESNLATVLGERNHLRKENEKLRSELEALLLAQKKGSKQDERK